MKREDLGLKFTASNVEIVIKMENLFNEEIT